MSDDDDAIVRVKSQLQKDLVSTLVRNVPTAERSRCQKELVQKELGVNALGTVLAKTDPAGGELL